MAKVEVERCDKPYKEIKQGDVFRVSPADNVHRMIRDTTGSLIAISMISGNREWNINFNGWKIDEFINWIKKEYPGIEDVYHYSNDDIKIIIK